MIISSFEVQLWFAGHHEAIYSLMDVGLAKFQIALRSPVELKVDMSPILPVPLAGVGL